jgi:hypothetical protein
VRLLAGLSGGAGASGDVLYFQFWDERNKLTAFYGYVGGGVGFSLKVLPKLSGTTPGIWNTFKTRVPVSVAAFSGIARFTTVGCGAWTVNYLNIAVADHAKESIYLSLNTGVTLGAGASSTVGRTIWYPEEVMSYAGG